MIVVPEATPVTTPVPVPMFTLVLLLLHTPPGVPSVRVMVEPMHTVAGPSMDEGVGLMVTAAVVKQPVGRVYVINTRPAVTPVTRPEDEPMVAIAVFPLSHVPPTEQDNNVLVPGQARRVPVIEDGCGLTVNVAVLLQPRTV